MVREFTSTRGLQEATMAPTAKPVRLTNGPVSYGSYAARRDGKQIFAVGAQRRGELVRYDPKMQEFLPFLGGISASDPTFSRDVKMDGLCVLPRAHALAESSGRQRTPPAYLFPLVVIFPRLSPDGTKVAFSDSNGGTYVVSMNGGTPQKLGDHGVAPDWSPDGNFLAITSYVQEAYQSRLIDVRNGNASLVPDSKDTLGPWYATPEHVDRNRE